MTRLNLSELAKQRLEKSHLRYEYKHDNNIGRIVSTYPDYKGGEYVVCYHYKKDGDILENKIENEFPQFISSVNVFRNLKSDESFKKFGSLYNFETGVTKMTMWGNNGADRRIELNCDEVSFGDIGLNVNVALKKENEGTFKTSKLYSDISENVVLNDEYFKEKKHVEKTINTDNFNVENCRNYEQKYSIDMERSLMWDAAINREKWMNMNQFERYEYANNKNNQIPVDKIKTTEIATYSTSLPIKGLLHADTKFLNKSLDYFNENGKSKEFTVLFDKTHKDFSEDKIKEMLLEENVLDNKLYNEFKGEYVKSENNLLEPSEEDFINAINEVNERAQNKYEKSLEEEEIDRRFRAMMRKMAYNIAQSEINEQDQGLER